MDSPIAFTAHGQRPRDRVHIAASSTYWLQLYPTARILVADRERLSKDRRKEFVARAATGDWDGIVFTQSGFARLPLGRDLMRGYLGEEIETARRALGASKDGKGLSVKRLERRIAQMEETYKRLLAEHTKDDGVRFEETGVDYLFVDLCRPRSYPNSGRRRCLVGNAGLGRVWLRAGDEVRITPGVVRSFCARRHRAGAREDTTMQKLPHARVAGPLAPFADGFRAELDRLGYTGHSREYKINEVAGLSRWLDGEGLGVEDITEALVTAALAEFRAGRQTVPTAWAMRPLLVWLREQDLIAAEALPVSGGAVEELIVGYRRWMAHDRGLAARTMGRYEQTASRFLAGRADIVGGNGVAGLDGAAVNGFLLAEAERGLAVGSVKGRVAELRSLLRYLHVAGLTGAGLADGPAGGGLAGHGDTPDDGGQRRAGPAGELRSVHIDRRAGLRDAHGDRPSGVTGGRSRGSGAERSGLAGR